MHVSVCSAGTKSFMINFFYLSLSLTYWTLFHFAKQIAFNCWQVPVLFLCILGGDNNMMGKHFNMKFPIDFLRKFWLDMNKIKIKLIKKWILIIKIFPIILLSLRYFVIHLYILYWHYKNYFQLINLYIFLIEYIANFFLHSNILQQ